ncbi:TolB family protein [Archaeoglobus neptunius]|uniref:TolB family protein n=1 Tax=Archaeoglobus neptunius TaxID=2798580 RepID=UPI001E349D8B|nr:hypothetical protein [Archaeoglobus neptunius]
MDYETRVTECFEMNGKNLNPKWSPDGSKIAFSAKISGKRGIWVMNADGSGKRRIGSGVQPEWRSESELCFLNNSALYCANVESREQKTIAERVGHYTLYDALLAHDYGFNVTLLCLNSKEEIELTKSRHDMLPIFSPDGKKVAFTTDRFGNYDIWIASRTG